MLEIIKCICDTVIVSVRAILRANLSANLNANLSAMSANLRADLSATLAHAVAPLHLTSLPLLRCIYIYINVYTIPTQTCSD